MRKLIKKLTPPLIMESLRSLWGKQAEQNIFMETGGSWEEAKAISGGYSSEAVIEKVRRSTLAVTSGKAAYERDSVLFDHVEYSWPLLTTLLLAAGENGNRLKVLDFGGALGSSFYQNRKYLSHFNTLEWNVVEQPEFVQVGRNEFETDSLNFYLSAGECLEGTDVALLSCVLPYLENPSLLLHKIIQGNPRYIVVDRHPILNQGEKDILTVQTVPRSIYRAAYPAWFFAKNRFLSMFGAQYTLWGEHPALGGHVVIEPSTQGAEYHCFIFKRTN